MKSKYIIIIGSLALVFWIGLIFYFSSQPSNASNQQSREALTVYERLNSVFNVSDSKFFNKIESFVFEDLLNDRYSSSNSKIRKTAHFVIYFVLGILASIFGWFYTKKWLIAALIGVCLPTIIAVLDEFIQGLTDRTSLLTDVVLDASGAFMGMCLFMLVLVLYRKVIKRWVIGARHFDSLVNEISSKGFRILSWAFFVIHTPYWQNNFKWYNK